MKLLPGHYKGNRRTWQGRQEKIVVTCAMCEWKSRLMSPQKAEAQYVNRDCQRAKVTGMG